MDNHHYHDDAAVADKRVVQQRFSLFRMLVAAAAAAAAAIDDAVVPFTAHSRVRQMVAMLNGTRRQLSGKGARYICSNDLARHFKLNHLLVQPHTSTT